MARLFSGISPGGLLIPCITTAYLRNLDNGQLRESDRAIGGKAGVRDTVKAAPGALALPVEYRCLAPVWFPHQYISHIEKSEKSW
jgi:hypothetical protein